MADHESAPAVKTEAEQVRDCFGQGRLSEDGRRLLDEALRLHAMFTRAEIQTLLEHPGLQRPVVGD